MPDQFGELLPLGGGDPIPMLKRELMIGRRAENENMKKFMPTITLAELNGLAKSYGGPDNRAIVIAGGRSRQNP